MRAIAFLAVLTTAAAPAAADSFVELAGGLSIPIADDDWTDVAESSPKIALRLGAFPQNLGAFLQADWTPVNTDATGGQFPGGNADISAHRWRMLVGGLFRHSISNVLTFQGRAGIGADIHYLNVAVEFLGNRAEESETDVGLGLEFGAGLWFRSGNLEIGGEIALPIGIHDDDNQNYDFVYTTYDIDFMLGVRFLSN